MPDGTAEYQPGVCNIGTPERQRRRRVGHLSTAGGLFVVAAIAALSLPSYYALASTPFFVGGAMGYLQDRLRFCAYYGRRGEYNLGGLENDPGSVPDTEAQERDRKRSRQIMLYSLGLGIGAAVLATLLVALV